jgi:hypothetical protein
MVDLLNSISETVVSRFEFHSRGNLVFPASLLSRRFIELIVRILVQREVLVHGLSQNEDGRALFYSCGVGLLKFIWPKQEGITEVITLFMFQ